MKKLTDLHVWIRLIKTSIPSKIDNLIRGQIKEQLYNWKVLSVKNEIKEIRETKKYYFLRILVKDLCGHYCFSFWNGWSTIDYDMFIEINQNFEIIIIHEFNNHDDSNVDVEKYELKPFWKGDTFYIFDRNYVLDIYQWTPLRTIYGFIPI